MRPWIPNDPMAWKRCAGRSAVPVGALLPSRNSSQAKNLGCRRGMRSFAQIAGPAVTGPTA